MEVIGVEDSPDSLVVKTVLPVVISSRRRLNLEASEGLKLILQIFVILYHVSEPDYPEKRLYNLAQYGVFAVGLYFQISGYLAGLTAPINNSNPNISTKSLLGKQAIAWLKWLIRRFVPLTIVLYLLHPFYLLTQPPETAAPDTLDMVTWTWTYWWYSDLPPSRSYNPNTTLWFVSALLLFFALTPILASLLSFCNRNTLWFIAGISIFFCCLIPALAPDYDSSLRRQVVYNCPLSHLPIFLLGLTTGVLRRQIELPPPNFNRRIIIDISLLLALGFLAIIQIWFPFVRINSLGIMEHIATIPWILFFFIATIEIQPFTAAAVDQVDPAADDDSTTTTDHLKQIFPLSCKILGSRYLTRLCGPGGTVPVMAYLVHWTLIPYLVNYIKPMGSTSYILHTCLVVFIMAAVLSHYIYAPIQERIKKWTS